MSLGKPAHAPISSIVKIVAENQNEGMQMAEVGAFCGQTTKTYIDIISKNNGKLYIVDWFKGNIGAVGYHAYREDIDTVYNTFTQNIKGYIDCVEILRGKTHDMIQHIPDKSLDICFIDADHTYPFVKKDIDLAIPKIKSGGILCGHDLENFDKVDFTDQELNSDFTDGRHCGVIRAVYEKFGTDVNLHTDTVWSKIIE